MANMQLSEISRNLFAKLGLPDFQQLKNFRLEDYIDRINIFKGIKPPAWLGDEFRLMFSNFPQWWQQKVGNIEEFFDPNNPQGMMNLLQRLIPADFIAAGIDKTKTLVKEKAQAGWEKVKEFAKERPGVTSLSLAAFFLPIFAPMAL